MKTINCIDCEVIKDLLPSYADKISSESSNKLLEEHLKKCKNCTNVLKNMNKEVDNEIIQNQEEQIDYLKGFKRKKIATIICVIIITILVLINAFLLISKLYLNARIYINVNEISAEGWKSLDIHGKNAIFLYLEDKKYTMVYDLEEKIENDNNKSIYIKVEGILTGTKLKQEIKCSIDIDENTNKIYLEDKEGNVREIWNKDRGLLIKDITGTDKMKWVEKMVQEIRQDIFNLK